MKKKHSLASDIILFMVILICLMPTTALSVGITQEEATEKYNIELQKVEKVETDDIGYLKELMADCLYQMDNAHQSAEYLRKMHYSEDSIMIRILQHDWWMYHDVYVDYRDEVAELESNRKFVTDAQRKEYPVASRVWELLKEYGYSDYVCAGIIGNMMAECGGQTLALNPYAYSPGGYYYGLCQWNASAYGYVFDEDVDRQIEVLLETIEYELDTFGFCHYRYFDYEEFLELMDEQEVALAFAECYERCGSGTYYIRQLNATEAYEYFTS